MKTAEFWMGLVAPPRCAGCGERFDIIEEDKVEAFCENCRSEWERAKISSCSGCGRESVSCICKGKYLKDTRILSMVKFGEKPCVDRLVYTLKHKNSGKCFDFAATELYKRLKSEEKLMTADFSEAIFTNVPRNHRTACIYGFDHAAILSEKVAELFGASYERLIKRKLGGRPQKKLGEKKRAKNVKGRFAYCAKESLLGRAVILVDDVMTTGATASECVKELRAHGASEIMLLTLARTNSKKSKRKKKIKSERRK